MQVLRTSFSMADAGSTPRVGTVPMQTILPAAALQVTLPSSTEAEGAAALQRDAEGVLTLAKDSTLQRQWRKTANAAFDLYSEPLIRFHVSQ